MRLPTVTDVGEAVNGSTLEFELLGFKPTVAQEAILRCRKRQILVTGGEQAGKSMVAEKYLLSRLFEHDRAVYWLVGVDYLETSREFEYLIEDFSRLGIKVDASKRVDPGHIYLLDQIGRRDIRIETRSARDPMKLTRDSPNGIIGCEAGQFDLATYERLSGRVAASRGWLFLCGTLENSWGWYAALAQAWDQPRPDAQRFKLPTWSNSYRFPEGINDPEIQRLQRDHSDEYFMERIAGEVVPPKGRVFPEFRPDVHIKEVEWAGPEEPIYLWEDPGYGVESAHALEVAQVIDGQVQIFDEIYEQELLTSDIISIAMHRPWWRSPKTLVSDPHYKDQHHAMSSVAEIWLAETGLVAGGERLNILPGVERLKSFLKPDPLSGRPKIVFSPRCEGILSEFGAGLYPLSGPRKGHMCAYSWKVDRNGNVVGEVPLDRFNHGIKACTYGLVWQFGYARDLKSARTKIVYH